MAVRQKIMKLAHIIGGLPGALHPIDENSPEYYAMAGVVSDEQADVAIAAGLRKTRSLEYLAEKSGYSLEKTRELAMGLADIGIFAIKPGANGEDCFYVEIFAPGVLELMMGNEAQIKAHPEIPRAFNEYTKKTGANLAKMLPMGSSLMRVIPVESAIDAIPETVDYERISYFMNKYDIFSVSDCSCRASRRVCGEGCGHLEKDMCLHLGTSAEYYVRTGKAHYITKEEAWALLKRVEENGLMHSIPNINIPAETTAICNCCSCACFGLRIGLMFGARDAIRSNFVAKIDEEKCVACGSCVETCPGNALRLGQKLCTKSPIKPLPDVKKVTENAWSKADWKEDYRETRKNVAETGTSPCKTACPAHIAVQGYIKLAAEGKYGDALELIKKENPFPAVCGRICNRRCEAECTRGVLDDPVAIDEVKKFIADRELTKEGRFVPKKSMYDCSDKKIAVVGSGPAGLSCAYYLALYNYDVTVFEKETRLGGMLTLGIPSFRLEKEVVEAEIEVLRELGVKFRTGVEVGKDVTLDALRKEGYKGFYIAVGAQGARKLNVEGEDAEGVLSGIGLLKDVNLGKPVTLPGKVIVIGGGNVAIDVARTAVRVGGQDVRMYCLESEAEMPALPEEIAEANAEGVAVHNGWGPKRILVADGKVTGVEFKRCTAVFDREHRFSPKYDENDTVIVPADCVLLSIGQSVEWGDLLAGTKAVLNKNGTVQADGFTYQTAEPDVFAGGDALTGPKFAIDAIAAGKQGAISLHRYVQPGQTFDAGRDRREYKALDKDNLVIEGFDNVKRQIPAHNTELDKSFKDTRMTFTEEQLKKETERCLGCGATQLDEYLCIGCGLCTTKCKFDAISMYKKYNVFTGAFETLPLDVAKYTIKRTGKIVAHSLSGNK